METESIQEKPRGCCEQQEDNRIKLVQILPRTGVDQTMMILKIMVIRVQSCIVNRNKVRMFNSWTQHNNYNVQVEALSWIGLYVLPNTSNSSNATEVIAEVISAMYNWQSREDSAISKTTKNSNKTAAHNGIHTYHDDFIQICTLITGVR
eukprot:scpid46597/ scgid20394/ 